MKIWAVLVLIALSVSILSSLFVSPPRRARRTDDHSHITLNACKAAGSAIFVKAKTPALKESLCKFYPLEFSGYAEFIYPQDKPVLIAFQLKHPPRV